MALPARSRKPAAAMKAIKAKRVSKIAKGRMAKAMVLRGSKEKTSGGLKKDALMKNKRGKIVSKRASANGRRNYKRIEHWTDAVMVARKALHLTDFVAINGKSLSGKALYVKAKSICAAAKAPAAGTGPSGPALSKTPVKVQGVEASALKTDAEACA